MDIIIRASVIYFFVMLLLRLGGNRSLAQITVFDFVLLLIISEATQQALIGEDFSLINAMLVIMTLFGIDIGLSLLKQRSQMLEKWMDGVPIVLVDNGELLQDRMRKARVDEQDILEEARIRFGLENIQQVKYAILEKTGGISIIPKERYS